MTSAVVLLTMVLAAATVAADEAVELQLAVEAEEVAAGTTVIQVGVPAVGRETGTRVEVVEVRLRQIVPLSGTNPFQPRAPVTNRDGQVYAALQEMQACGGFGSGCLGTLRFGMDMMTEQYRVSIDLDPDDGSCSLRDDDGGRALVLVTPPVTPPIHEGVVEVFPNRDRGDWEFADPGLVGNSVRFRPADAPNQTFFLRSRTGRVVVIGLAVLYRNYGDVELTVHATAETTFPGEDQP